MARRVVEETKEIYGGGKMNGRKHIMKDATK